MKKIFAVLFIYIAMIFIFSLTVGAAPAPDDHFTFDSDTGTITGYSGPGGDVEIPSKIGGVPVTGIGHQAFALFYNPNHLLLTSVIIPDSVTYIESGAFRTCANLAAVYFEHDDGAVITFGAGGSPPPPQFHASTVLVCSEFAEGFDIGGTWNGYSVKRVAASAPVFTESWKAGQEYKYNLSDTVAALTVTVADLPADCVITYQWYENSEKNNTGGTPVSGETGASYTPPESAGLKYYYVEITNTNSDVISTEPNTITVKSSVVTVSISNIPVFTVNLPKEDFVCYEGDGEVIELTVAAKLTAGTVKYQWYVRSKGQSAVTPISGATGASYSVSANSVGTKFYYAAAYDQDYSPDNEYARALSNTVKVQVLDYTKRMGIDYSYTTDDFDIIIIGQIENTPDSDYIINLTKEKISLKDGYRIAAYSLNGGTKWKPITSKPFNNQMFVKLLSKNTTLSLTDKYDKDKKGPAEDAVTVNFAEINKRPKFGKYIINYLIGADPTGETTGSWVLSVKNGDEALKDGIEIAASVTSKKKAPDSRGYGRFYPGDTNGIDIKKLRAGSSSAKTTYFVRTGASENDDGTYTPASKAKKVAAASEQKTPNYKADKKKNIIKHKANTNIFMGDINYEDAEFDDVRLYTSKGELDISGYSGEIYLWTAATIKKPASAKQKIRVTAALS